MDSPKPRYRTDAYPMNPAGIYIHIPFCRTKCPYCDFISSTDLALVPAFLKALEREIALRATDDLSFDSIYFGGGTPSLLAGNDLARLLNLLKAHFRLLPDTEITVEGNPGSLNPRRLAAYREAGVNRLNIGVQSFQDPYLRLLGRGHTADRARAVIREARAAGFDNLGLDLIYGLPDQTVDDWQRDLDSALTASPEHLSCYLLTFEAGTRFDVRRRRGELQPLDEAAQARLFSLTRRRLDEAGYDGYEISNFARRASSRGPDWRSRHNRKYWNHTPYLGLGPAAHSFRPPRRAWNEKRLRHYCRRLSAGELPVAASERLTPVQEQIETIYLSLRQTQGLNADAYADRFGQRFEIQCATPLAALRDEGLVAFQRPYYRLTEAGLLVADGAVARLINALSDDPAHL